MSIYWRFTKE